MNPYYDHSTYPATGAQGSSSAMRSELDAIEAGFDKLPTLSGNGGEIVIVNAGETALEAVTLGAHIAGSTAKTTLVDADVVVIADSAASSATKKVTWANVKAAVRSILLTGLSTASNVAIAATDTILEAFGKLQAQVTYLTDLQPFKADVTAVNDGLALKQDVLVSATNIKTINSASLLGSGDISTLPGALTLLATLTPTAAANVDALSTFTASYDNYLIIGQGILPASTDSLYMRLGAAGAADTGNNYCATVVGGAAGTAGAFIRVVDSAVNTYGCGFVMHVVNANDATNPKAVLWNEEHQSAATPAFSVSAAGAAYTAANAITGIRLYWQGGANFAATGKIRIYGYNNT
jgi:hypothetical protein